MSDDLPRSPLLTPRYPMFMCVYGSQHPSPPSLFIHKLFSLVLYISLSFFFFFFHRFTQDPHFPTLSFARVLRISYFLVFIYSSNIFFFSYPLHICFHHTSSYFYRINSKEKNTNEIQKYQRLHSLRQTPKPMKLFTFTFQSQTAH